MCNFVEICRSLFHTFVLKIWDLLLRYIFLSIQYFTKIYFIESLLQNFVICFFVVISHMFLWMNKFPFTGNNFLPHLKKRKVKVLSIVSFKVFLSWMRVVWKLIQELTNFHKRKCQSNNTCAVMFALIFSFHRVITILAL